MKETLHTKLTSIAKRAINELFGDTSVSKETTLQSLEEVKSEADELIAMLRDDIRRDGKGD